MSVPKIDTSYWCGEGEERGEKVSMKTHATAKDVGKNCLIVGIAQIILPMKFGHPRSTFPHK